MDSRQDSGQDTGTSLVDAATLMGTTPAALRKRLQRGSVPGYKRDGQWFVLVDSAQPTGSPRPPHGQATAIVRTDDQRAADLAMVLDRIASVYEAQIAAQEIALVTKDAALAAKDETIAELRRRAEQAEAERDRLAQAQAAPDASGSTEGPTLDSPSPEPSAGFWARVRRVFGGE